MVVVVAGVEIVVVASVAVDEYVYVVVVVVSNVVSTGVVDTVPVVDSQGW